MFQQSFNDLAVGTVIKGKATVSVNGEVIHLVVECGCAAVFCGNTEPDGNGLNQPLALCALCVNRDRHFRDLLDFW